MRPAEALDADLPVITSTAVLVEVIHPEIDAAAPKWTLPRPTVEPVTQAVAQSAAASLRAAGLHGHKYAIDAMLCTTALRHPGRLFRGVTQIAAAVHDPAMPARLPLSGCGTSDGSAVPLRTEQPNARPPGFICRVLVRTTGAPGL
ncbi:hypothetical protein J2S54_003329 [Streptomyces sp. DSM 42143]|nr:hypothetical protein [Streptomyces sp. DSM 42143]